MYKKSAYYSKADYSNQSTKNNSTMLHSKNKFNQQIESMF